jgi:hypothetical protein
MRTIRNVAHLRRKGNGRHRNAVAMTKSSQQRYRDVGGTSDQRTQLSTARWPCAPNSRWQLSLMRSGTRSGSSGPQAVKRTSDNIKSNILI